jgi:hypothetical protein
MGGFTVLSGVVLGCCLPDSFKNPRSTFLPNVKIFEERELQILQARVLLDDPMKGKKKKKIGLPAFKKAVCLSRPLEKHITDTFSSLTGVFGFTL